MVESAHEQQLAEIAADNPEAVRSERALIVDDSFDRPVRGDLDVEEIHQFWERLDPDDPKQAEELTRVLGTVPVTSDAITDEMIASLYEQRHQLGSLQDAFDSSLRARLEEVHAMLDPFLNDLKSLGYEVVALGTEGDPPDERQNMVFLDYYLGDRDPSGVHAAEAKAREILSGYQDREKPLFVLMSREPNAREDVDRFRKTTSMIRGMFYFVPKVELLDPAKLRINLHMLTAAVPTGHLIQGFIDTFESKANAIVSDFASSVRDLGIDDYAYIQRLSLQADGQPLGDYLLWLYSAYFGSLLFEQALGAARHELDRVSIDQWIPSQSMPSAQLTSMYHAALYDSHAGPPGPHPLAPGVQDGQGGEVHAPSPLPYLALGDMFKKPDREEVVMVCNPACDLQLTGDGRRGRRDDSILLIPGTLQPLSDKPASEGLRTDLFRFQERPYRIHWFPRRVQAVPYDRVSSYLEDNQYEWLARLRVPFSLEIQQQFASNLMRIGVPAPPPLYRPLRLSVYVEGEDGQHAQIDLEEHDAEAFIATYRVEEQCILTGGLIRALQRHVEALATQLVIPPEGPKGSEEAKRRTRAEKQLAQIKAAAADPDAWIELSAPIPLPKLGSKHMFHKAGVELGYGITVSGKFNRDKFILVALDELNLVDDVAEGEN